MHLRRTLLTSSESLNSKKRSKTLFLYVDTVAAGSLDRLHNWAHTVALALKSKAWGFSGHPSVTGARLLNLSSGWQVPPSCPSGQKGCRAQNMSYFCCAESRWWHGAADGYGKASGLKLGLTCVKQKVFATHEPPEKEPDVTACFTEVENYCEASIESNLWGVKAAVPWLLPSETLKSSYWAANVISHNGDVNQVLQPENHLIKQPDASLLRHETPAWALERTNQREQTVRNRSSRWVTLRLKTVSRLWIFSHRALWTKSLSPRDFDLTVR